MNKDLNDPLSQFNALWYSIEKHMGVDPDCAHWADNIRNSINRPDTAKDDVGELLAEAAKLGDVFTLTFNRGKWFTLRENWPMAGVGNTPAEAIRAAMQKVSG